MICNHSGLSLLRNEFVVNFKMPKHIFGYVFQTVTSVVKPTLFTTHLTFVQKEPGATEYTTECWSHD